MFSLQHEYYEKTGSVNCFSPRLYYRWENEAGINDKNKIYGNFEKKKRVPSSSGPLVYIINTVYVLRSKLTRLYYIFS